MKLGPGQVQCFHLLIRNCNTGRVGILIKFRVNSQARVGGRVPDSLHDDFMIDERSAAPVLGNVTKHPMRNFVPFTGAGREVTHMDTEPGLIRQALQFDFPEPTPTRMTPTAVSGDE